MGRNYLQNINMIRATYPNYIKNLCNPIAKKQTIQFKYEHRTQLTFFKDDI